MKRSVLIAASFALGTLAAPPLARAAVIALFDYALNLDGAVTANSFPGGVSGAAFDTVTGLGSVQVTVSGPGVHYAGMFVDHEIDEAVNTYFNETGAAAGVPSAGQSWEVDEPGYISGDIYGNLAAGTLDNALGVSVFGNTTFPDDVSMALAHDFTLGVGESAELVFTLGLVPPAGGFYLTQTDPDSDTSLYFSSTLMIIPEPSLAWLPFVGAGLATVWILRSGGRRN